MPPGSEVKDAALYYAIELGWHVIPLHSVAEDGRCSCGDTSPTHKAGKHPRVKAWEEDQGWTAEKVKGWARKWPAMNIGVGCGRRSGLVMVGPDGQGGLDDLAALERQLGPLPPTLTQLSGTAPGRHLLFAWPDDGMEFPTRMNNHGTRIDTRGCDAAGRPTGQFVVAPSRNGSGPYRWLDDHGPGEIQPARLPPAWLNWFRNGPGKAEAINRDVITVDSSAPATNGRLVLRMKEGGRPSRAERAEKYLATCDEAVDGQNGHSKLKWAASCMVQGFDLDDATARELLLRVYNPTCRPPWAEKDIDHKVSQARSKPLAKPWGWLLDEGERPGQKQAAGPAGAAQEEPAPARLVTRKLSEVRPRPVRWLVPGYVPLGKLTLLAGEGGHGKSTLTLNLAADVTRGRPAFGLKYEPVPPSDVILISCEDDAEDTVVPRLMAAGADLARCHEVLGVESGQGKAAFSLSHYLELEAELEARPEVRLVVIDPAGAYIGSKVDDHKDSQLRALLSPLAELAARRNVAVVLIKHLNKGVNLKAVHRVGGSVGYVNTVRSALLVAPDNDDDSRKLLLPMKANLTGKKDGLAYCIDHHQPANARALVDAVEWPPGDAPSEEDREALANQMIFARWLGLAGVTADEALRQPDPKKQAGDIDRASAWLKDRLAGGPVSSLDCVKDGNAALGIKKKLHWWRDKIFKGCIGGKPDKVGFGDGWVWGLPAVREDHF